MFGSVEALRAKVHSQHWSVTTLRLIIIFWAAGVILLALFIDNPWLLAGILAWEVLP